MAPPEKIAPSTRPARMRQDNNKSPVVAGFAYAAIYAVMLNSIASNTTAVSRPVLAAVVAPKRAMPIEASRSTIDSGEADSDSFLTPGAHASK